MPNPISLEEFNKKPHLSPAFFELGLELVGEVPDTPWNVHDQAILRLKAYEVLRYKVSQVEDQLILIYFFSTNCGMWKKKSRTR